MNEPDSMLTAGQLAVMAVAVVLALAAWLGAVFLAARQSHSAHRRLRPPARRPGQRA